MSLAAEQLAAHAYNSVSAAAWRNDAAEARRVAESHSSQLRDAAEMCRKQRATDALPLDPRGYTPLHYAAALQSAPVLDALLDTLTPHFDADTSRVVNARAHNGETPLHSCASATPHDTAEQCAMAARLVKLGANIDARDQAGVSVLSAALRSGSADLVTLLLDLGAQPNAADVNGVTPLHVAAVHEAIGERCVVALKRSGGAIDVQDVEGDTPLHYAVRDNVTSSADALLRAGSSVDVCNSDGESILEVLDEFGSPEMRALFERNGVSPRGKHAATDKKAAHVAVSRKAAKSMVMA